MGEDRNVAGLKRKAKEKLVRAEVERLLGDSARDDRALLRDLEELSKCYAFNGLTWLWGPELYRRNRVLFRPFIVRHFSAWAMRGLRTRVVSWKGQVAEAGASSWRPSAGSKPSSARFSGRWRRGCRATNPPMDFEPGARCEAARSITSGRRWS
jgi:hypothetical protein